MYRILEYTLLFIVVVVLQVFLFDNMRIGFYLNPFIYLAFVILLPVNTKSYIVILLAAFMGIVIDFLTGTAGVSTASTALAAFCRPAVLKLFLGTDEIEEGGIPNIRKIGVAKFIGYSLVIILLHNIVFFALEALSFSEAWFAVIRIAVSTTSTLLVVYFCQLLFIVKRAGG